MRFEREQLRSMNLGNVYNTPLNRQGRGLFPSVNSTIQKSSTFRNGIGSDNSEIKRGGFLRIMSLSFFLAFLVFLFVDSSDSLLVGVGLPPGRGTFCNPCRYRIGCTRSSQIHRRLARPTIDLCTAGMVEGRVSDETSVAIAL